MQSTPYLPKQRCRRFPGMILLLIAAGLIGCDEPPTLDPPEVRWGQDVCSACSMIISEDRYASAIVSIVNDERHVHLFDDLGEMFEVPAPTTASYRRWVCDAQTRDWIDAETAIYVRSAALHTPMGRGIAAFEDEADAKTLQAEVGGELLQADDLAIAHPPPASPTPTP